LTISHDGVDRVAEVYDEGFVGLVEDVAID